jgi:AraC family transcriptional regulator, regulatory protein of adaptative response / methylated-DNA-[protein]-cysteine methyltransferase
MITPTIELKRLTPKKSWEKLHSLSNLGRSRDPLRKLDLKLEVVSSGELLEIRYGIHDTLFGQVLIATNDRGICNLCFVNTIDDQTIKEILQKSCSYAQMIDDRTSTQPLCDLIFNSSINSQECKPLTLLVGGSDFQVRVWQALLNIPFGGLTTYQNIAETIDRPNAVRAVGNAIGNNPIAYLIPCHRVIRKSGELGGYRWGLKRKAAILAWEGSYGVFEL